MQKTIVIIVFILLLGAGTLYFYGNDKDLVSDTPNDHYIKGDIISINKEAQSFLVAEGLKVEEYTGDIDELEGNAIHLTVTEETEIRKGDREITLLDLITGEKVKVWVTGPVMESYPARGTASLIAVEEEEKEEMEKDEERSEEEVEEEKKKTETEKTEEKERKDDEGKVAEKKECFVGGCSGELCTENLEVISTCEHIAGMECLGEEMSCELVEGVCTWVLSEKAARCFSEIEEEYGEIVRKTRIGYFFEKAESVLK